MKSKRQDQARNCGSLDELQRSIPDQSRDRHSELLKMSVDDVTVSIGTFRSARQTSCS